MKTTPCLLFLLGLTCFGIVTPVCAQDGPEAGGNEIQLWTAGGHGVKGITQHTGIWSAGFRYGWILTEPHGPGFLRGSFEYAVEAVPAVVVFQPTNTAFGAAINPFGLKWNFDTSGSVVPYVDLGGGALFTNVQVPAGTSRINFTTSGGVGLHFLTSKVNWSADVRYVHISNAGLEAANPGINTLQLRVGIGWFTHARR